jgi:hypothetical protein
MQLAIANLDSEYDSIARAACTEKQLAMLEAIPLRLPHLSSADLLAEGLRIRRSLADATAELCTNYRSLVLDTDFSADIVDAARAQTAFAQSGNSTDSCKSSCHVTSIMR